MKTRLLKRLRKRFDWKFAYYNGKKTLYIYDKHWLFLFKKHHYQDYIFDKSDFGYLLEEYGDKKLIKKHNQKIERLKFNKL